MIDVLVAGAGPAGSIAAIILARVGARVVMIDRAGFPRDKLCGDTLNPGTVSELRALGLIGGPLAAARPLAGMIVSGPHRCVEARYGAGLAGLAVRRRDLDQWLVEAAVAAGVRFEPERRVKAPLVEGGGGPARVRGLVIGPARGAGADVRMPAAMTIAADGRHSGLARALGLVRARPPFRRWAFGTYATGVHGVGGLGEMHIRPGFYLGLAPITDTLVNVCVVTGPRPAGCTPMAVIRGALARAAEIGARFDSAEFVGPVSVLGPLAVDVARPGVDGLLLAGDAAGFVDPMTGDGLCLAMRGAVLAAGEAQRILAGGDAGSATRRLARARHRALGVKLRFNRLVRRLVASPAAVEAAEWAVALAPGALRHAIRFAGDVR